MYAYASESNRSFPSKILLTTFIAPPDASRSLLRYMDAPKPVYDDLLKLVQDKDYFVITTNVDHCFKSVDIGKQAETQ